MPGEVAQLLDGIAVRLANGDVVTCRPPSVRNARILIKAYRRVFAPKPPAGSTAQQLEEDEVARERAIDELVDLFPTAVAMPEAGLDGMSSGDILRVLPSFFWKGTGAVVLPEGQAMTAPPTGTPSGEISSPPA